MAALSNPPYYRIALQDELSKRIHRNSRYSIRAFAHALQVSPSALSQILAGSRTISQKVMDRLIERLELTEEQRAQFVSSVYAEKVQRGNLRINRVLKMRARDVKAPSAPKEARPIDRLGFEPISEWHHYAVRELLCKKDFRADARWISNRLGISVAEARVSWEILNRHGLVRKENGRWIKAEPHIDTADKRSTSIFHRTRQRQILEKSIFSLENDPIEERNHSAITLCTSEKKIAAAKERIQKFMWELTSFLEDDDQERVYELSVQLFPLERPRK